MRLGALYIVFLLSINAVYGQLKYYPIKKTTIEKKASNARIQNSAISLPFWDDFSFTPNNSPLDSLWQNSRAIYVGDGFAIDPPSVGVASFDGVNERGERYDGSLTAKTDSLTSCPLKLGALSVSQNVYLSFYYQFAGNGDQPEETDSLQLEFKNADGQWVAVWPQGAGLNTTGNFVQVLVKVDDPSFFHDQFQFKFQSFGRPQGVYDLWNLDYVYMNSGRSPSDNNYPDRTIGSPLTSIFKNYRAIPATHYSDILNSPPSYEVTSVDNPTDEVQPYDNYFESSYTAWKDSVPTTQNNLAIYRDTESVGAPNRNVETHDNLFGTLQIPENMDSVFVNIKTYIVATDNVLPPTGDYDLKFSPVDFRVNDTINSNFVLKDYYAYDDGSAEAAVGLSFSGNRLAVMFPFVGTETDTLVAVDMYFPLSKNEPRGRSVDLMVWKDLNPDASSVLYKNEIIIQRDTIPNKFIRYNLNRSVALADTFFIGYRQNNEGELAIGFDVNTDNRETVFYNVGTAWIQKTTDDLSGSFMIRPVFGKEVIGDEITSDDEFIDKLSIYPNPNNGAFYVDGYFDSYLIYDWQGKMIKQGISGNSSHQEITISQASAGLYFIQIFTNNKIRTFKIIKK